MHVRYNQEVSKVSSINDKVNDLEAKLQELSAEKIPWPK